MTHIFSLAEINAALPEVDVVTEVAEGFVAYSKGMVDVPPVGELLFPAASGEMHIKYGAIKGDSVIVIKVATGFFRNPEVGLPPFGGCMVVLSQSTGMVECVLLEEGELTNHRTAAAGAVCAKFLAPSHIEQIGIVGSGVQARLQADYLRQVTECRRLAVWGRTEMSVEATARNLNGMGYDVTVSGSLPDLCANSQLIVTTTPAQNHLIEPGMIQPGTHITAMGSDTPEKNEIASAVLSKADLIVADSIEQSYSRGEIFQARQANTISEDKPVELGTIIEDPSRGRRDDLQITLADLTGVAVQDIAIAKAVMKVLVPQHL